MWGLICSTSEPLSADRPEFGVVCKATERLADEWRQMVEQGLVRREGETSPDLFDLLDRDLEHRTPCTFSVTSDWGDVVILTQGAHFMRDPERPSRGDMIVEDKKVGFHTPPHPPPYPTLTGE